MVGCWWIISSAECSPTHTVLDGGMRNVSADYADAKCMIDGRMAADRCVIMWGVITHLAVDMRYMRSDST